MSLCSFCSESENLEIGETLELAFLFPLHLKIRFIVLQADLFVLLPLPVLSVVVHRDRKVGMLKEKTKFI